MIFARYKGPLNDTRFIFGKLYPADESYSSSSVQDADHIRVTTETGQKVMVKTEDGFFEYFSKVYAAVVRPVAVFERGQVVLISDSDDVGEYYKVDNGNFYRSSTFELLDKTNVVPGIFVLNIKSGCWMKVLRVDELLNLAGADGCMKPVVDFRFAVGNGGILNEPMLKCINCTGVENELTEGHFYRVESVPFGENNIVHVQNNLGVSALYLTTRFTFDY